MVSRKLLVTGAAGMLGHTLLYVACEETDIQLTGVVRRTEQMDMLKCCGFDVQLCDIADEKSLNKILSQGFQVVINCAGITKSLAIEPVETIRINAIAPHLLARACTKYGARLICISTDCVFSGQRGNYSEEDIADPVDLYGRSKLLGEVTYDGHLTVRTSFIGRELSTRHGLLEWFLAQREPIQGYTQAFWSGLTTLALSRILLALCWRPEISGLLHVGGECVNKYTLLRLVRDAFDKQDVEIRPCDKPFIDRSMNTSRFRALGIDCPTLPKMICDLAKWEPEIRHFLTSE